MACAVCGASGAERGLPNGQRPAQQRLRRSIVGLREIEDSEVVQRRRDRGIVRTCRLFEL